MNFGEVLCKIIAGLLLGNLRINAQIDYYPYERYYGDEDPRNSLYYPEDFSRPIILPWQQRVVPATPEEIRDIFYPSVARQTMMNDLQAANRPKAKKRTGRVIVPATDEEINALFAKDAENDEHKKAKRSRNKLFNEIDKPTATGLSTENKDEKPQETKPKMKQKPTLIERPKQQRTDKQLSILKRRIAQLEAEETKLKKMLGEVLHLIDTKVKLDRRGGTGVIKRIQPNNGFEDNDPDVELLTNEKANIIEPEEQCAFKEQIECPLALPGAESEELCAAHQLCYICGGAWQISKAGCDAIFLEDARSVCLSGETSIGECMASAITVLDAMEMFHKYRKDAMFDGECSQQCVYQFIMQDKKKK